MAVLIRWVSCYLMVGLFVGLLPVTSGSGIISLHSRITMYPCQNRTDFIRQVNSNVKQ